MLIVEICKKITPDKLLFLHHRDWYLTLLI